MHGPFGHGGHQRPERIFGNDRQLPFIHWFLEQKSHKSEISDEHFFAGVVSANIWQWGANCNEELPI